MQTTVRNVALGIAILAILIALALFIAWINLSLGLPTLTPVSQSSTTPTQFLLNEQFDNLQYDGSFNESIWVVSGENDSRVVSHAQSNGVLTSVMQPLESQDSEIHSFEQWTIEEIDYSEWRVKVDDTVNGDWASLALGFESESGERFVCDLRFDMHRKGISCAIWPAGQDATRVTNRNFPLQSNTWYVLRIAVVNNPLEFSVHLDDELLVSYVVSNSQPWENWQIHIYSSLAGDKISTAITTRIDYAFVAGK